MSEDISCAITPPNSPSVCDNLHDIDFNENDVLDTYLTFRWFCCLGEAKLAKFYSHNESYLNMGEENFISAVIHKKYLLQSTVTSCKEIVVLFGYPFDKGSAILFNCKLLFKMLRCKLMLLENASKLNNRVLGSAIGRTVNKDYNTTRRNCISLFLYIREYLLRLPDHPQYCWILKELFPILTEEILLLRLMLKHITNLPDYIINHAANSSGNKSTQPAYHLFHCHLDLRWLHTTTVLILANIRDKTDLPESEAADYGLTYSQKKCVNNSTVEHTISLLISDLVMLAIARFEKIEENDLIHKSLFTCSCVAELWILVQSLTDDLEAQGKSKSFWKCLNLILEDLLNSRNDSTIRHNCTILLRPATYTCSNPLTFSLNLIKHLAMLYNYKCRDPKSNFAMVETILKNLLNTNIQEIQLRINLSILDDILLKYWEPKTDTVVVLWEYFHKRFNSTFFIPGASLDSLEIMSKSALGLVSQVLSRLEGCSELKQNNLNSFQMFLKILGSHLRKTSSEEKHWKQLRGRIYSKLSAAKMTALSETGIYNFVSLFLTLAVSADMVEVTDKMQHFLGMITESNLDLGKRQIIWKSRLASIILLAEKGLDFSKILTPIIQEINVLVADLKNEHSLPLLRTFVEALQDILDCNDRITSSHCLLFGKWISRYLADCQCTDASRLLDIILIVINRLRNQLYDPFIADFQENLWNILAPYLRSKSCDDSIIYQTADIGFGLSILSLNTNNSHEHFKEMFNIFVLSETIDIRLTRRFLFQMIQNNMFPQSVINYNKFIIKAWIKCLTLSSDRNHTEVINLTNYVASLPSLLSERLMADKSDPLLHLFSIFANKYKNSQDTMTKIKLRDDVASLFEDMDRWMKPIVKMPKSQEQISRLYFVVGNMVHTIPFLLYVKSKPNSIIKMTLDVLLLPISAHNPEFKLHPFIITAVTSTLHFFIEGLIQLGPRQDPYISRTIRELITIYLPRCVGKPGSINASSAGSFSLVHSIKDDNETSKIVLETINIVMIKKKAKTPHMHCSQSLKFLSDILTLNCHDANVVTTLIKHSMDFVCDVVMFCEDGNMCKRQARDFTHKILNCDVVRLADQPGAEIMLVFSRLCREYLAFSSRQLFELFYDMLAHGPDLIARFMPILLNHVKEVENKRGVGYDRSLRMGVEKLELALKSVKN
uniref:Protein MMS22-like n=2 Tax=Clastoptera arizonana TaxID=38151 RepID=A0A1B6DB75_9HEMI